MSLPLYHVDAFASTPFAGNPAAIVVLDAPLSDDQLQAVAAEMNLSETAYLLARATSWQLRWFTPATEVDLCGHATLAAAHVLWESGRLPATEPAVFATRSGELRAARAAAGIELDFPTRPATTCVVPPELEQAIRARPLYVGKTADDLLVEVASASDVRDLKPVLPLIARLDCRGVIVTAAADDDVDCDFVSRFFAPQSGIPEDPVTGSAHCTLGEYWQRRLGRSSFRARQLSARGGELLVQVVGDRVRLIGQAVTVVRGELVI